MNVATFRVGDLTFGLQVDHLRQIIGSASITPVPLAPKGIVGLVDLRGVIVPAAGARDLLELESSGPPPEVAYVIDGQSGPVAFIVDQALDVIETADAGEPPPESMSPRMRTAVAGVLTIDGADVLLLHTDSITGHGAEPLIGT